MSRKFKMYFEYENDLSSLEYSHRIVFSKFRCRDHKLPIETGSHKNVPRELRICLKCNSNIIGDDPLSFHYVFVCSFFRQHRLELLTSKFYNNPSVLSFNALLSSQDSQVLGHVCKFLKVIFNVFGQ